MDIVENQTIGYQVIELDALSLFYSAVVCNDTLSSKKTAEWQTGLDSRCSLKAEGGREAQQEKTDGSTNPASGSDA